MTKRDAKPQAKPEAKSAPPPEAKVEPKLEAEPKPANDSVAALLDTSLGEFLVAGLVKDPEDAGRVIAAAITQQEARLAASKASETEAGPSQGFKANPSPQRNRSTV